MFGAKTSMEFNQRLGFDENGCKTFYYDATFKEVCVKKTEPTWLEWISGKAPPKDRFDVKIMIGGVTGGYAKLFQRVPIEKVEEHLSTY